MMKNVMVLIGCILLCTTTLAQNMSGSYQLRADDQIKRQLVTLATIGAEGQNQVWDVSDMDVSEEDYVVEYSEVIERDSLVAGTEDATRYYYGSDDHSLLLWGYENNLTHVDYDHPELQLQIPLVYGDCQEGLYHGKATYCERLFMRLFGSYSVEVDGTGALLLPSGDTLRHVSRVHIRKLSLEQLYPGITTEMGLKAYLDSISPYNADSIRQYLQGDYPVVETNTYRWYAAGYRYPVLESISVGLCGETPQYAMASYCAPEEQEQLQGDAENEALRLALAAIDRQTANGQMADDGNGSSPMVNVDVLVSGSTMTVHYDLTQEATVRALVCDVAGVVYRQQSQTGQAGDSCLMTIPCDGLHHGQYVLYLNVSGHVTSYSITL